MLLKIAPLSAMADPRKLGTGDWKHNDIKKIKTEAIITVSMIIYSQKLEVNLTNSIKLLNFEKPA